ncbi:hypothetical protein FA13DRAFT_1715905 [Coprinellus micaceus]|uniref:Uncharacterized protein n=1 Tax=Coprinellus micaceus TaxID=71717 RepID=A0A4Y7SLF6_COPMI|nr:hypothetical protein FA13DRAFT_1715905 [Coprinellus micaceus]
MAAPKGLHGGRHADKCDKTRSSDSNLTTEATLMRHDNDELNSVGNDAGWSKSMMFVRMVRASSHPSPMFLASRTWGIFGTVWVLAGGGQLGSDLFAARSSHGGRTYPGRELGMCERRRWLSAPTDDSVQDDHTPIESRSRAEATARSKPKSDNNYVGPQISLVGCSEWKRPLTSASAWYQCGIASQVRLGARKMGVFWWWGCVTQVGGLALSDGEAGTDCAPILSLSRWEVCILGCVERPRFAISQHLNDAAGWQSSVIGLSGRSEAVRKRKISRQEGALDERGLHSRRMPALEGAPQSCADFEVHGREAVSNSATVWSR